MKNLLALVGAAVVTFVGLGWYLGWYNLTRQPGTPGTQRFQVDVNPNKFTTDVKKGVQKVEDIYEHLTDENNKPEQTPPAGGATGAPGNGPANSVTPPADANRPVSPTSPRR